MGPGGPGAIYRVTDVLNADGSLNASTPPPTQWFDVQDLNVIGEVGKVNLGTVPTNAARLLGDHTTPATDIAAFHDAARVGIGGMATSLDGRAMFITDLHDKAIYGIRIDNADVTPTEALPIETPVGTNQQLWAISTYRDRLYLGLRRHRHPTGRVRGHRRDEGLCGVDGPAGPGRQRGSTGRTGAGLAPRADRRPRVHQGLQHGGLADPCHHAQRLPGGWV